MKKPVASSPKPVANSMPRVGRLQATSCKLPAQRGFTLIEMIVAVALFAVVMLVSTGALLSLVGASRKAQALQSVINNLNIALDGMVRSLRMGSDYDGSQGCSVNSTPSSKDCTGGSSTFKFEAFNGDTWIYSYDPVTKRIYKSQGNGLPIEITAPDIRIDSLKFYVIGTANGEMDQERAQPKVVMVVKGTAGAQSDKTKTTFNIQATAVQRVLDP